MSLARYCAYFFVTRRLGTFVGGTIPADASLPAGTDRAILSAALADAVDGACPTCDQGVVRVDAAALLAASSAWRQVFDVRDSLLACAHLTCRGPADQTGVEAAFADYVVTRWVFKEVLGVEIRRRPLDRPFPPSYDRDAKRGLAETLAATVRAVGLEIADRHALVKEAADWGLLGDARSALMKQVPS